VFYFLAGIGNTIFGYSFLMDLQRYDMSLSELNFLTIFPFIPWGFKCLTTAFSDTVKCGKFNQKPYILLNNLFAAICCFVMLAPNLSLMQYCGILFSQQLFVAWLHANYDSVMIYEGNLDSGTSDEGKLQNRCNAAKSCGRIIGYGAAAPLWFKLDSPGVFGIMSLCYLLSAAFGLCFTDMPVIEEDNRKRVIRSMPVDAQGRTFEEDEYDTEPAQRKSFCFSVGLLTAGIRNKHVQPLMIFVGFSALIPSISTPVFFFLNDVVHLSALEFSMLSVIGEVAGVLLAVLFDLFLFRFSLRNIYLMTGTIKALAGVMSYLLTVRGEGSCMRLSANETVMINDTCYFYEEKNISAFGLAIGDNVLGDIMDDVQSLALMIILRAICYHSMGPTTFQTSMAVLNLLGNLQKILSSYTMLYMGIDHGQFENLPSMAVLCIILDVVWTLLGSFCLIQPITVSKLTEQIVSERFTQDEVRPIKFKGVGGGEGEDHHPSSVKPSVMPQQPRPNPPPSLASAREGDLDPLGDVSLSDEYCL
jgi:hypothetical protein